MTVLEFPVGPPPATGFRSIDVCNIADVTYRQLDYWARTGLAEPTVRAAHGSGTVRLYSDRDVLRVAVVATMLRAGFALATLREVLPDMLSTAETGVGFFNAPNVVVTIDLAALQARIDQCRDRQERADLPPAEQQVQPS